MNFVQMAKQHGMPPKAYAEANIHANTPVGKMARMWYVAQGVHGRGESNMSGAGPKRNDLTRIYQVG